MLLRNVNERLQIISRKDCKNEATYNQKLLKIRLEYMQKYKTIVFIGHSNDFLKPLAQMDKNILNQSDS
jgi:hypothetical protein